MLESIRHSLALVDRDEWFIVAVLLVAHVVTALLETAGAGMVFLFFRVAMDVESFGGISQVRALYEYLGISDRATFMALLTLLVLLVFLARSAIQAWTAWLNLAVLRRLRMRVVVRLFNGYIRDAYINHLGHRSSTIMNNLAGNAPGAVAHCTLGLVDIFSAGFLTLVFMATLFYVKPMETLITCTVLGGISGFYWFLMHERLSRWGRGMMDAARQAYKAVSEAFGGIKTLKVLGVEPRFEEMFGQVIDRHTMLALKSGFAGQVPRLALEVVLITGILSLVAAAFVIGRSAQDLIPTLALFGVASLRIMPAFTRIVLAMQLYKGAVPCLEEILDDYQRFEHVRPRRGGHYETVRPREFEKDVALQDVGFAYDDESGPAVSGINLRIAKGQFVGFAGHSGSGKTTTADIILGLLTPSKGQVVIDGQVRAAKDCHGERLFGYVPQDPFIIDDTLRRNVALGIQDRDVDEARVERAIRLSALESVVKKLPEGLDSLLGERGGRLSGGERQRLGLARALYFDAPILVLDEPTSALDATTEAEISRAIDGLKEEKTIIMIAHRLSTIARCDRLFYFESGELVATGSFNELLARSPGFREMVEHLKIENHIGTAVVAANA